MPAAHHLADALAALIKSRGLSYRKVAAGVGIAHSNLSRLRDQRLESTKLRQLISWWSDESARSQLLAAHLWDEITRAGLDPSSFWDQLADEDGRWFAALPPKLQAALRGLGDTAREDSTFIDLLDAMAAQRLRSAGTSLVSMDTNPPARFASRQPSANLTLAEADRLFPDLVGQPPPARLALAVQRLRRGPSAAPRPAPNSLPSESAKAGRGRD